MAVAAQRAVTTTRRSTTPSRASSRRVRVVRRPHRKFARFMMMLATAAALVCLFGYVSVYANLALAGYNRSKLMDEYRAEMLANQRLKVQFEALCSPNRVVIAAEKTGMVYGSRYDYIGTPQTVASAD